MVHAEPAMDTVQTLVIGAGVVGLAIARELARSGREVVVVERAEAFGTETSSRNSEVIHAGIYYAPGSLKAELCVAGRQALYDFCERFRVLHRRCGKLIVAPSAEQRVRLERIVERAERAGVHELQFLSAEQARALEPALRVGAALFSPQTGIVDSHGLMLACLGDAQDHGATLALRSRLVQAECRPQRFVVTVETPDGLMRLQCEELVNAAGLGATEVASRLLGLASEHVPMTWLAKGHYFSLAVRCPFSRLVYPTPDEASLGVHLTLDLAGRGRFGPDVQWVSQLDYGVDPARAESFYAAIREYWPQLPDGALEPAYAGIRPKLVGPDAPAADFRLDGAERHGLAGLVNLFGIESPGLTASLAIAGRVRQMLDAVR